MTPSSRPGDDCDELGIGSTQPYDEISSGSTSENATHDRP